jgi:hypothetical protein
LDRGWSIEDKDARNRNRTCTALLPGDFKSRSPSKQRITRPNTCIEKLPHFPLSMHSIVSKTQDKFRGVLTHIWPTYKTTNARSDPAEADNWHYWNFDSALPSVLTARSGDGHSLQSSCHSLDIPPQNDPTATSQLAPYVQL